MLRRMSMGKSGAERKLHVRDESDHLAHLTNATVGVSRLGRVVGVESSGSRKRGER